MRCLKQIHPKKFRPSISLSFFFSLSHAHVCNRLRRKLKISHLIRFQCSMDIVQRTQQIMLCDAEQSNEKHSKFKLQRSLTSIVRIATSLLHCQKHFIRYRLCGANSFRFNKEWFRFGSSRFFFLLLSVARQKFTLHQWRLCIYNNTPGPAELWA